jgi:hypothetical protein
MVDYFGSGVRRVLNLIVQSSDERGKGDYGVDFGVGHRS